MILYFLGFFRSIRFVSWAYNNCDFRVHNIYSYISQTASAVRVYTTCVLCVARVCARVIAGKCARALLEGAIKRERAIETVLNEREGQRDLRRRSWPNVGISGLSSATRTVDPSSACGSVRL